MIFESRKYRQIEEYLPTIPHRSSRAPSSNSHPIAIKG
jgi:hypothetical protein